MSSSTPSQQGGAQSPNPQQGQTPPASSQPGTKKTGPQQSGGTAITDWASI